MSPFLSPFFAIEFFQPRCHALKLQGGKFSWREKKKRLMPRCNMNPYTSSPFDEENDRIFPFLCGLKTENALWRICIVAEWKARAQIDWMARQERAEYSQVETSDIDRWHLAFFLFSSAAYVLRKGHKTKWEGRRNKSLVGFLIRLFSYIIPVKQLKKKWRIKGSKL